MTVNEKAAYLKGLFDGLDIKKDTDEGKLFASLIDTIAEMASHIHELEVQHDAICDELDLIEEALEDIDDAIDDLDSDLSDLDDDLEEITEMIDPDYERLYGYDEDEDEDDDDDVVDWEEDYYELTCPSCGEEIVVDEDVLAKGEMKCPTCGEDLEFDLSSLEGGCSCGCQDEDEDNEGECDCGCKHEH